MFNTLKLLIPALIPSWRFFDEIAPSPRIEINLLENTEDTAQNWQEYRPRPDHLSIFTMTKRLFWNAQWNESLFLMSCAERLMNNPTQHSHEEILRRISRDIEPQGQTQYIQYRLVFLYPDGGTIRRHIAHLSETRPIIQEQT